MPIVFHAKAVFAAAAAQWVFYVLWFSPFFLGGLWQRLEQVPDEGMRTDLAARLGLALAVALAQALCLEGFFNFTHSDTFTMGALAGLQLGLGLAAPGAVLMLLMGRRKPGLIPVYVGWLLLSQALAGGILGILN